MLMILALLSGYAGTEQVFAMAGAAVRKIPMEIHVYSEEIPWSAVETETTAEYTSINEALAEAIEGDTIVVHEGIYREMVNIKKDGITLEAAEGEYVLVTGAEVVSGFVADASMPGVYVADVPEAYQEYILPFSQVFANGAYQNIARFPNYTIDDMMAPLEKGSGYGWVVDIHKPKNTTIGAVTFRDDEIPDVDLTDGVFRGVIGKNREYVYGTVTETAENRVFFDAYSKNNNWSKPAEIKTNYHDFGFGFILHKNLIDIPGEWFVEDRKIYYMPEGDIKNLDVEMQVRKDVLTISDANNVTIENINFVAGNVPIKNVSNTIIDGCTFRYMQPFEMTTTYSIGAFADSGLYLDNAFNTTIQDTYIAHTWGNGVYIAAGDGITLSNCIIEDIGWCGTFTAGFYTEAENNRIEDTTFRDNGRFQTRVNNPVKIDIIHSLFERPMKMGEDSGAIAFANTTDYAYDIKGSEIAYNIIRDFEALPISSMNGNYNAPFIVGMYLEELTNYTVHHNLFYDLIDEDYVQNFANDKLYKTAAMVYFAPRHKVLSEENRFYNNTGWDYLSTFHIYNIEIMNYDELKPQGLPYNFHHGSMKQGSFVNNIFAEVDSNFSHSAKLFAVDGSEVGSAKLSEEENQSLRTDDIDEYFIHAAANDYYFNPQTNMAFDVKNGSANYVDPENGDFRLVTDSAAKAAGTAIAGITSSDTPDLGALEGSDYVLSAGATLKVRDFKEIR